MVVEIQLQYIKGTIRIKTAFYKKINRLNYKDTYTVKQEIKYSLCKHYVK